MIVQLLTACILFLCTGIPAPDEIVLWNKSDRLSWSDFQGAPPANSGSAALTSSGVTLEYSANGRSVTYKISCHFDKERSWGRVKNPLILAHEQGHFDISEIYARRLYKALMHYRYRPATAGNDINKIYQSVMQNLQQRQNGYDAQTDHSRNVRTQKEWLVLIEEELEALDAYADYS